MSSSFTMQPRPNETDGAIGITKPLLLTKGKNKNMVYSPLSIHIVLSVMASGTKGSTQDQLLSFLRSNSTAELNSLASDLLSRVFADGSPSGGPNMSFANGLWVDKSLSIKPSFKQVVDSFYKAAANQVDFKNKAEEVRTEVNSWAENETKGLIKEFLPPRSVNSRTTLIFANALYFKGAWAKKFDERRTHQRKFHLVDGSSVRAHFMTSDRGQFVRAFDGFKVLELPYEQGEDKARRFSMYLILPDAKDGLPALVYKVSSESDFLDRHRPRHRVEVGDFRIPKFKFSTAFEASKILKDLGLVFPFTGSFAEMVDLPPSADPLISKMLHESFIEVNEEGTEAAAVTSIHNMSLCDSDSERMNFVADHPFMFLIREEITRNVIFIGQILNPLEG